MNVTQRQADQEGGTKTEVAPHDSETLFGWESREGRWWSGAGGGQAITTVESDGRKAFKAGPATCLIPPPPPSQRQVAAKAVEHQHEHHGEDHRQLG